MTGHPLTFHLHRRGAGGETIAAADLTEHLAAEHRPSPDDRPWMLVNMISSLDGAVAIDGLSGGLGAPADKAMFRALRGLADAIVVGAGTARAEGYGTPVASENVKRQRRERGQTDVPTLAIVTRSARLDPADRMFADAAHRPLVYTAASAASEQVDGLRRVADVVIAGADGVDPRSMVADLRRRGHAIVLAEGGPSLNADLMAAGVVDEFCLSISPLIVGGDSRRVVSGALREVRHMQLDRMLEAEDLVFLRYLSVSG